MIELYFYPSPNGIKVAIMLEECGLEYKIIPVDITRGAQFEPKFLEISPNNKIPALVDTAAPGGPLALFESGAILTWLGEKTGRFLPADVHGRYAVLKWLFWQVGGLGPMAGQAHHFRAFASEHVPYGIRRYTDEVNRLYGVMDRALAATGYLAGDYSIADMAAWPWVQPYERQGQRLEDFPQVQRWFKAVGERPAVQRALALGHERHADREGYKHLYGQTAASLQGGRREGEVQS
jgi:GSH-dependent disulfide-bond oxidoreductase